jgi:plasmid maintenance system antidote protein VapI
METTEEKRGFRVRVIYPILAEYRYAVYPNAKNWRVAERSKSTVFSSEDEANEAAHVINEDKDVKAVEGRAEVEHIKSFDPDWCIHPGVHLKEHMLHLNLTESEMAMRLRLPVEIYRGLLNGSEVIGSDMAERLAEVTGRPAQNWYNLESNFREDLKMGRTWTKDD